MIRGWEIQTETSALRRKKTFWTGSTKPVHVLPTHNAWNRCFSPTVASWRRWLIAQFRHSSRCSNYPANLLDKQRLVGAVPAFGSWWMLTGSRRKSLPCLGILGLAGRSRRRTRRPGRLPAGHAPAEGDKPIEDRPAAPPIRSRPDRAGDRHSAAALPAGAVPAGAAVAPSTGRHIFPNPAHPRAGRNPRPGLDGLRGLSYRMRPGEVWALNNVAMHAVWNSRRTSRARHDRRLPAEPALLSCSKRGAGSRPADADVDAPGQPATAPQFGG
jgi:hypothetical protein